MDNAVITVTGRNRVGIIYGVTAVLAGNGADILDISQTIVQGIFNMMMIVDVSGVEMPFQELSNELKKVGENLGVLVLCQKEEIFDRMHRI